MRSDKRCVVYFELVDVMTSSDGAENSYVEKYDMMLRIVQK